MTRPFRVIEGGRHDRLPAFVPEPAPGPLLTPAQSITACVVVGVLMWGAIGALAWVWCGGPRS
jgi:hypothetical protein